MLCGACDDTHGKVKSRACQLCGSQMQIIVSTCVVAIGYTILGFSMMKNALSTNTSQVSQRGSNGGKKHCCSEIFKVRLQVVGCEDTFCGYQASFFPFASGFPEGR